MRSNKTRHWLLMNRRHCVRLAALTLAAFNTALTHRQPPPELLFHTDRGVQYAAADFRSALANANAVASMSRKGNCYDNASMESF